MDFPTWPGKVWSWFWSRHFLVPRLLYTGIFAIGILGIVVWNYIVNDFLIVAALTACAIGAGGVFRWALLTNPSPVLAISLFPCPTRSERSQEVQALIETSLLDHLEGVFHSYTIKSIPVLLGRNQKKLAIRIQNRLGAEQLLYGDIRDLGESTYSVYARLAVRWDRSVYHVDPHTKEVIPQRMPSTTLSDRLTPAQSVQDVEYPLEFASELEAIIRSVEGEIYAAIGRNDLAVEVRQRALDIAPDSKSTGIDRIRVTLSWSLFSTW